MAPTYRPRSSAATARAAELSDIFVRLPYDLGLKAPDELQPPFCATLSTLQDVRFMKHLRIYLENGTRWVFASALDWPGWSRRGKGDEAAVDVLLEYADRYAKAVGVRVPTGSVDVVGRVATRSGLADFGAPGALGPWDDQPLTRREVDRQLGLLEASWAYLDEAAAASPSGLRKGPRGGGRDRDAMLSHVREAERAYAPKVGARVPPRTPWAEQRPMILAGLRSPQPGSAWPVRYAIRRLAWHVLDHAWEMEDRSR